jgi:hypothetical protein
LGPTIGSGAKLIPLGNKIIFVAYRRAYREKRERLGWDPFSAIKSYSGLIWQIKKPELFRLNNKALSTGSKKTLFSQIRIIFYLFL